jgi:HEAT repeat protein
MHGRFGTVSDTVRELRRKFRSFPVDRLSEVIRDSRHLAANGVESENDLTLAALNRSLDLELRQAACWFLARLLPKRAAEPVLLELATATNEASLLRCEAVQSLGLIKSRRALQILLDLALKETDRQLRESSVYSIGFLSSSARALQVLLSMARNADECPQIRGDAIEQIGVIGKGTPEVLQTLRLRRSIRSRARASSPACDTTGQGP